jgi:hypothetical protein
VLLALGVASVVALRALLPLAVERGAAWGSRQYLGLPARIDNVDFELLRGRVVFEGIALGSRPDGVAPNDAALEPPAIDPTGALVHVARVTVQLTWRDLLDRTVRVPELVVEAPSARVERESDGRIDPLRHAQPVAVPGAEPEPPPAEPEEPSPPWKIAVDRFELRSPDARLVDAPSGQDVVELALDLFALDHVAVQGSQLSLGGVGIDGPLLKARRDLLLAPQPEPAAPAPAAPAAPAPAQPGEQAGYRIDYVDVQRATFTWITEKGPLDIAITLKASDISADHGKRFPLDLLLEIGDGRLRVAGDVGILPPAYTGKVEWDGIPIPRVLLASLPQFADWLQQATSTAALELDADPSGSKGAPSMRVEGRLAFDALQVSDPKGTEITLGWKQLEVVMRDVYAPLPQEGKPLGTTKASLESVKLVEPHIRYTRPSPQLDALLGIDLSGGAAVGGTPKPPPPKPAPAVPAPPGPPAEPGRAAAPLELEIGALEMTGGEVEAIDNTVKPVARTRVGALALAARDVRFPDPAAHGIDLRATLPLRAKLEVKGDLAPGNVGDFTLRLRQLDLPVFNPYASAAAGVTIDKGTASVSTKLRMRGARMQIENDLVLNRLGVSMRDPASFERQFGVPLDLALALLRDPKGDIKLAIPVKMDEKGATIGIGAIVASAIKAAVIGAVTSPLKMVGAVFGGSGDGGISFDPLPSEPGRADLAGDPQGRIDGLAAMMGERPSVALSLRGQVGPEDRPLVAEQMLGERWQEGKGLPEVADVGFLERRRIGQALSRRAKGEALGLDDETRAIYQRYVAAIEVPDDRLAALARARALRVQALLAEKGVVAGRVAIGEPQLDAKPGVAIGFGAGG